MMKDMPPAAHLSKELCHFRNNPGHGASDSVNGQN